MGEENVCLNQEVNKGGAVEVTWHVMHHDEQVTNGGWPMADLPGRSRDCADQWELVPGLWLEDTTPGQRGHVVQGDVKGAWPGSGVHYACQRATEHVVGSRGWLGWQDTTQRADNLGENTTQGGNLNG